MAEPIDIVILTNGPGEVATWVKPVVRSLYQKTSQKTSQKAPTKTPQYRISVLLSPCPHASGQEATVLQSYAEVSRVQSADHFFKFLLTGKTKDSWQWHPKGVVVFLGGDQFYTLLVAKRLGYRTVTYAEWDARWIRQIDSFGVMRSALADKAPARYQHKFTEVGDLMADVQTSADRAEIFATLGVDPAAELIGFLPGSKPVKLTTGLPLSLAIAHLLHSQSARSLTHPSTRQYVIGVAPNLTLTDPARYADPALNPAVEIMQSPPAQLIEPTSGLPYFQIENGPKIFLWQRFPALDLFSQCQLCFTTIGANTAQLGALATPMIAVIPTQRLEAARLADGLLGFLARLPGAETITRNLIDPLIIKAVRKSGRHFAWPNIWAKREIVPELFGPITAPEVVALAQTYLTHPEKLANQRQTLQALRGPAGAADKMASLILQTVHYPK
ncbi:MAG: lipid-A-disaccharide synthase [Phormidesmis priestleyi]|uniref:Lipid-A-disaccharide synthase n=1 Tax=Phormidesmis priestleyi TaxID=268141 RepID=A0A2W4XT86_9CYAN|nr:MAG: lipid-A-disaccharide synthase [Phormidesmis priestleyi]